VSERGHKPARRSCEKWKSDPGSASGTGSTPKPNSL